MGFKTRRTARTGKTAKRKRRRKKSKSDEMTVMHPHAAGIDIGATKHWVAVAAHRAEQNVREFGTFTADLHELVDWLQECGIETVAMESTGVYWVPLYEILEERGLEVFLVNARHAKNVPGRKTDVQDCQWLQKLHTYGLLRASFRPDAAMVPLRTYMRHRQTLVESAATHIRRMQKALDQMNVQLHHVISDITGKTGMAILRAIVSGTHKPEELAELRQMSCHASVKTFVKALTGNYRPEYIFILKQELAMYDSYQQKLQECDVEIKAVLVTLSAASPEPEEPCPPARTKRRPQNNEPRFEVRDPLYRRTGVDLTQIDGIGSYRALRLVSEIGDNVNAWPTAKNFTSWLCLAPNNKVTGGKVIGTKTQSSASRAAQQLRLAAMSVGKTQTALGAFYRRLGARIGKAKAITATARKLAEHVYRLFKYGTSYKDPGANYYEERYHERVLAGIRKRAKKLGFELTEISSPAPITEGVS